MNESLEPGVTDLLYRNNIVNLTPRLVVISSGKLDLSDAAPSSRVHSRTVDPSDVESWRV